MKVMYLMLAVSFVAGCAARAPQPPRAGGVPQTNESLFAGHFEGDELNAAGLAKLDAIPVELPAVIVIHVTPATDRNVFVRRARDVRLYAAQRGINETQIRFVRDDEVPEEAADAALTTTACVADDNR
jgi:hypothetical protein